MSGNFPESDWKTFKRIHAAALQRYSQRKLEDLAKVATAEARTPQERLLDAFNFAKRTQREMASIFDDYRRSTAFMQLFIMHSKKLIEPDEWSTLTEATRDSVKQITGIVR